MNDVATKRDVERTLREVIRRLEDAGTDVHGSLAESLPEPRIIQISFPDLDASYWSEMSNGRMGRLRRGEPERADIRVRMKSDILVDLVEGRKSLFSSFLGGQVRIEASFADLLRLRRLT